MHESFEGLQPALLDTSSKLRCKKEFDDHVKFYPACNKFSWTKALNYHKINMERHDACRHWVRDLVDDFHDESLTAKISNSSHHMPFI